MENNNCGTEIDTSKDINAVTGSTKSIISNVKFNNEPLQEIKIKEKKRKREEEAESKRLAEEEYNREVQEQQYKRLMHLLNRSKFYASYIVDKINNSLDKDSDNKSSEKVENENFTDENTPPQEKGKKKNSSYYTSKDVQKIIHMKKNKLNLSDEEIEHELDKNTKSEIEDTTDVIIETPKYFNGNLRDYQKKGFQWLKILYENGINGILADEMGLGKTVQVIALLCHLIEKRQDGPYLLIVPLSTIPNWMLEFERFAPKLPIVLFHGTMLERSELTRKVKQKYKITNSYSTLPIVLTTFEVPISESHFIRSLNWRYIIIDEGHRIKNHECQLIKILRSCKSMNRLLLTGTPLQNNLSELWSLLNFLLPEIFDDLAVFKSWFDVKEFQNDEGTKKFLKLEKEKHILSSLREILQPFLLRREKTDVCLDIPPKKELVVYAPLTELQHDLYKAVLKHNIDNLSETQENLVLNTPNGTRLKRKCVLRSVNNSMNPDFKREMSPNSLLQESEIWKQEKSENEKNLLKWEKYINITERNRDFLINICTGHYVIYKKIVNHPYLIHYPLGPYSLPKIDEDLVKSSGKLLVLDIMLARLKKQGHKVLLFSTMTMILNIIEDYLSLRDYKYVRLDGVTNLLDRKENIKNFNSDPEMFLFIISTRAGGVGLNLVGADTVIIYDSDWNPQVDIQAMARCHRIGQSRPVMIYKLCTKGTIDEAILKRAEAKRLLERIVISKGTKTVNVNHKGELQELQELLESKECHVVSSENEVFTEEELNKLLDRSSLYEK